MSDDTAWVSILIAGAGLAFGLYQYRMNSWSAEQARTREGAIKAADEIEKFHADENVSLALAIIDYGAMQIPIPDPATGRMTSVPFIFRKALEHHTTRSPPGASDEAEKSERFRPEELRLRAVMDQFLLRLERIESLIAKGVIPSKDFGDLFEYWLELIGERPRDIDQLTHFSDGRRRALWSYIRQYRFNGVVRLFARYARAARVGIAPDEAFVRRILPQRESALT
jgi:hypothetical protein